MKSGIVGCGSIAAVHAGALAQLEGVRQVAFVDTDIQRARQFAGQYGAQAFDSLESCLDSCQLDVLHICTPHHLHTPMVQQAMERGIHVFLEKPPVISWEQLEQLKQVVAQAGPARLGICFQNRFNGSTMSLRQLLQQGQLGRIVGARAFVTWCRGANYYTQSGWRGSWRTEGGGVLINQAIHTLDLLVHLLGPHRQVRATMANHHLQQIIEVEDTVDALIEWEHCSGVFFATTAHSSDSPVLLEIACEGGSLRLEGQQVMLTVPGQEVQRWDFSQQVPGKSYWGGGHQACIGEYYRCLASADPFELDLAAVLPTMELVLDIYSQGRPQIEQGDGRPLQMQSNGGNR